MKKKSAINRRLNPFQFIILAFLTIILLGTVLLMLPISTVTGGVTPFNEALFTSTSAVCVIGMTLHDTAGYWSEFGHVVILILIQIGGVGVITFVASMSLLSGSRISLLQRSTIQEVMAAPKVGGVVRLTGFVIKAVALIELIGALVMMPVFCSDFGLKGIWMAIFHSVSAFCNAGFDIMGYAGGTIATYATHPFISVVIMSLVIIGGIGFLTWDDLYTHRYHFKKYKMQSKVILVTSAVLTLVPAVYFFFFEFGELPVGERIISSFFQAVMPRTAGFNTVNLNLMTGAGQCVIIILMIIGGSPGSTAGGIKTTTAAVLFANIRATLKRKEHVHLFGRRIEDSTVKNATTLVMMYVILFVGGALVISMAEGLPMDVCLFETVAAVGTAGLSLGITSQLGIVSQCVLMLLMFFGRVGGMTVIYAAFSGVDKTSAKMPQEKITIG